jgi:HSP20 family protein
VIVRVPVRREPPEDRRSGEFRRLRDRLLADLERWPQLVARSTHPHSPPSQVCETADAYLVDVDLPGVAPEDLTVDVAPGRLVVEGRRRARETPADGKAGTLRVARLELPLPPDVDGSRIAGVLEHGVLHLTLPRAPSTGRHIPVRGQRSSAPPA